MNKTSPATSWAGEFTGKGIVITGAGSGIGRATALAFAEQGARLALLDVSPAGLDETIRLADGGDHVALECDVSDPAAISRAFSLIDVDFGPVDVLVNNAGINPPVETSLDVDEAYFDRVMDVNSKGIFFCAQAAMRSMVPRRSGVIVNLGSVSGMIGWGGSAVYSASKGAVLALTKALAIELAPYSVRVNAVAPGSVRTPMVQNNIDRAEDPDHAWERIAKIHPLGRPGEPQDIADAIMFLASSRSSFVTGSILTIDGGLTAQ
jgi:NAD(P)-dependent dehydrogenase (short-subunit alcohol dehydrogenase family)